MGVEIANPMVRQLFDTRGLLDFDEGVVRVQTIESLRNVAVSQLFDPGIAVAVADRLGLAVQAVFSDRLVSR